MEGKMFRSFILVFTCIIITALVFAYEGIDGSNRQITSTDNKSVLKHRNKRGDCWYRGGVQMSGSCYCGDHCMKDKYGWSFYGKCDLGLTPSCCIVKYNDEYQLSSNCQAYNTYLDFNCTKTGSACIDGLSHYACSCSDGFLQPTTPSTCIELYAIIVPSVVGLILKFFVVVFIYVRCLRKRDLEKLVRLVENGYIPIRCNVMILVDNQDEFKYYTAHLMAALRELFPSIVCERLCIYHLFNDNYHIECDKLLVFRISYNTNVLKEEVRKKVTFRNGTRQSVFILCREGKLVQNPLNEEIHVVPRIKNIETWLPQLIKFLCKSRFRICLCRNNSYFINTEHSTLTDSIYCEQLCAMIENVLNACGAVKKCEKQLATCKLVFVNKDTDNLDSSILHSHVIFVTYRASLEQYRKETKTHVYGIQEAIFGIFHILKMTGLVTRLKMPKIKGARYDPIQMEFIGSGQII